MRVSEWNGKKDPVRDGVDGFRIPTTAPSSFVDQEINKRFASGEIDYDFYLGLTSVQTSVSIPHATQAFQRLLNSKS